MEAVRWKGYYFDSMLEKPQEWNEVVATIGLSLHVIKYYFDIINIAPLEQFATAIFMTYMVKVQSPGPPKPMNRLLLLAILIPVLIVEVREVISIIATWKYLPFPEYYLVFLGIPFSVAPVLAGLLLYLRPSAIANYTNSPQGRELLYSAKVVLAAIWLPLWLCILALTLLKIPMYHIDGLLGECLMSLALAAISLSSLQTPANSPSDSFFDITLHMFYLVALVLSPGGGLLYCTVSLIILLGVLLFDNLQIPTALAQAVFSFPQVLSMNYQPQPAAGYYNFHPNMTKQTPYLDQPHHHMRIGNATIVTYSGLAPSSTLLYLLAFIQAMLYLYACMVVQYSFILCKNVDLRSGIIRGQRGVGPLNLYFKQAYTSCIQAGVLAPRNNASLSRFAINSVSSNSRELQLAGVYILDCFLKQKIGSEEELISVISRDSTAVSTMISMLACPPVQEQDTYIRLLAARITAVLAGSLRIASTPNLVRSVSSLLDEAKNQLALQDSFAITHGSENENNNRSDDIGSVITRNESPPGQESSAQPSSGCLWFLPYCYLPLYLFTEWILIPDTWEVLEEQEPMTSEDSFPILALQSMKILESLADNLDRCVEIGRAPALISNIIGFISWTSVTGNSSDVGSELQKEMVCLSLNLLRKLGNKGEEVGVELRQHLWKNPLLLHRLAGILVDTSVGHEAWEPAIDIIAKLVWDHEARKEIGSTQVIIGKLMQAFLETGEEYPPSLRMAAGEALANLAIEIPANCSAILKEPRYDIIKHLQVMLYDTSNRLVAANLLQNLCAHCTQDRLLPSSIDHLSSALITVMDTITSTTESKHLEALLGLASQICNVQGIQLHIHEKAGIIVDKMVGALKGNMIPNPEYPRMRRVTIEMAISITKLCSRYATILREKGMIDLLSRIEILPPSKVEKYRIFFGNVGVVLDSGIPLPELAARAKHLIDPTLGTQPGGNA